MPLDLSVIRAQFPALLRECVYLDNPAGTQVARTVLDRMKDYLTWHNANHEGAFATSRESDALVEEARMAAADFLNARDPQEIVFGPNMTSLTFNLSRSLARTFNPGDEIVVTRLDHDANVTPWVMAAQDRGCNVTWVDFHPEDGTLNMDDMQAAVAGANRAWWQSVTPPMPWGRSTRWRRSPSWRTKLARSFISMQCSMPRMVRSTCRSLDPDFLVCSSYKFFGPHMGVLYGKYDLLDKLTAYKVRPAPQDSTGQVRDRHGQLRGHVRGAGGAGVYRMGGGNVRGRVCRALCGAITPGGD